MKIREIILDFTSLLDVIMIILFFFILFSHFETEEMKQQYEEDYQAMEAVSEAAAEASEAAEQKSAELDNQLQMIAGMDSDSANNLQALMEFSRGTNLKAYLKTKGNSWTLEIQKKNEQTQETEILGRLTDTDNISLEIKKILYLKEYEPEDRIMFAFIYNGDAPGTDEAYEQISKALTEVRWEYKHFYCSETDTSILESE